MTAPITTKRAFYRAWHAGLLGNKLRTWGSPYALALSGFGGHVTMRTAAGPNGLVTYRLPVPDAIMLALRNPEATYNESAPDEMLVMQGEIVRAVGGLDLYYDTTPNRPMNVARKSFVRAQGLTAKLVLDRFLWPTSRDDLDALLDLYPDHVIEFSAYERAVGQQPHRNTLIWEVRRY